MNLRMLPVLVLLLATACSGSARDDHDHDYAAEQADPHALEATGEVPALHLEPAQVRAWGVRSGPIERTDIAVEMTLPGVLALDTNRTALIAPLAGGRIAGIMVDLGSRVEAGQTVAALNAPDFTLAQSEFLMAVVRTELSRDDYERARGLRERQALEEREFLRRASLFRQHLTEEQAAEGLLLGLGITPGQIETLRRRANIEGATGDAPAVQPFLPVTAPLSGTIVERNAVLGEHISPGHTLFTLSDLGVLWAWLDAYEHQIAGLSPRSSLEITTALFPGRSFPGRITYIGDQVDPVLRTVPVRVEVPNREGLLKPNMYVQGLVRLHTPDQPRLVVPEEAVQLLEGHHVVFVLMPPDPDEPHMVFEARQVEVGPSLSVGRIVLSGLEGSEQVVVHGAFTLKAEMTKGAAGQGHVH